MRKEEKNYAFIDSQNLNLNIRSQGWILDFARFRIYLKEKYGIKEAYLFIGYVESNKKMYDFLNRTGYKCIFKPTLGHQDGTTKGNCDAELVLHTMIQFNNFDKAVIVTGDGDFYCLVEYLLKKNKLGFITIPNKSQFSALFKVDILKSYLRFLNNSKEILEYKKEKTP
ncbi:MAG: NYN domain-containing protein [bacterium]